ncbi:hypothetical protein SAMN03080615_00027 [Amphritea atlantica]|uniref:Uncharacterized protein n=1 Tax=Amphritea atlantica TaxID=355243 RepID=A0A1H9CKR0_9GAMM|nr:hypothetical protein [Amphritea atlantica]SEQ01627.1 hypothetical protein SAMN03080615_00027 [Amphritea atlantica]
MKDARIIETSNKKLGRSHSLELAEKEFKAVKFNIESEKELYNFFVAERNRPIQIFCKATGATREGDFKNIGYGPFYGKRDISRIFSEKPKSIILKPNAENGKYAYSVIAFLKLEAGYTQLHYGIPETALKLTEESFEGLSCYLNGLTYPPLLPPQSNTFGINTREFEIRVNEYNKSQ